MKTKIALLIVVFMLLIGAALPAAAQTDSYLTVYSTAQRFEGGLMLFRSDTAYIWVLANNGTVQRFPSWRYSRLPDNTVTPPSGHIAPLFGFGKIWGNYASLRNLVGYPVMPELGFSMGIQNINGTYYLTQLDGTIYQINSNGTWTFANSAPPPPPNVNLIDIGATFQPYENGFMIWRADTGAIYTFTDWGNGQGSVGYFAQAGYETYPDNSNTHAPAGRIAPVSGFGRVWGSVFAIRSELGWATAPEQTYQLTVTTTDGLVTTLNLPNGMVAQLDPQTIWWRF